MIQKEDWFTVPNILSYIRILLIPLYVYLYLNANSIKDYYAVAVVLVLSGITDALDGIVARKTGQITVLGKILDPLADKLTQIAVISTMFIERPYILPLLVLFVFKEIILLVNNIILIRKNIMMNGAKWYGKVATATFYICMFLLIIFPTIDKFQSILLIRITAGFQLLSLIGYSHWFLLNFKEEKYQINRMDD